MPVREFTEQDIETASEAGIKLTGHIGTTPMQTYYTPDGQTVRLSPSIREYIKRDKKGKVIESGTRDANLDRGLLLSPPIVIRPHCPHCDNWHDNQKQIDACGAKRRAFYEKHTRKAKKELSKNQPVDNERIDQLEADMGEIKSLLQKLVKGTK